jgi:hypothetical protein
VVQTVPELQQTELIPQIISKNFSGLRRGDLAEVLNFLMFQSAYKIIKVQPKTPTLIAIAVAANRYKVLCLCLVEFPLYKGREMTLLYQYSCNENIFHGVSPI